MLCLLLLIMSHFKMPLYRPERAHIWSHDVDSFTERSSPLRAHTSFKALGKLPRQRYVH